MQTNGSPIPSDLRISRFAVASLVLSVLNLCPFVLVGAAAAIYCGLMARKAIRESAGRLLGKGMANTGILLAVLGTGFHVFVFFALYAPTREAWDELRKIDGIVSEFQDLYRRQDAKTLLARLSPEGRSKITEDELARQLAQGLARFGPIESFSRDTWSFFWQKADRADGLTRCPYELKGSGRKFRGIFYCRKSRGAWLLERFELE